MEKRQNKKNPKSTTKIIMFSVLSITVIISFLAVVATFYLRDSMIMVTLLPCLFTECGVVTGFYFWKRKVENLVEFKHKYGEQFMEDTLDDI